MMDESAGCVLDQAPCQSCKHLFDEKDNFIEDLKRELLSQEIQVQNLRSEVRSLEENLANVVKENDALQSCANKMCSDRSTTNDTKDDNAIDRTIKILQDQLARLEAEKKHLNEKVHDFEHETEGLARMFGMQQEKFEHEMKKKDKTIRAVEEDRKLLEEELRSARNEFDEMQTETEKRKELVEKLNMSVQEKNEEVFDLSKLHNETEKAIKELQEQLTASDKILNTELSKNEALEKKIVRYMEDMEALSKENRLLKTENNHLSVSHINLSEEKIRVEKEMQRLNPLIESLQNELRENKKNYVELEECYAKLKQEKNDTENEVRNLEKKDMKLRNDIENLKKEAVLGIDQKNALESKMSLVQAEIKKMEDLKFKLQNELLDLRKCLEKAEEALKNGNIEKGKLQGELKASEKVINDLESRNKQQNKCLRRMEEHLESETKAKKKLEEEVQPLKLVVVDLKEKIKQKDQCIEETKRELDSVITVRNQLSLEVEKRVNVNKDLKVKISNLSKDIENLQGVYETKAKNLEHLERNVNEKSRIISSLEKEEKKLQNDVEELLSKEETYIKDLKDAKDEITKLKKENVSMAESYEKVSVRLHECMQKLNEKNEMYVKSRNQYEKQVEELSLFREHNAEISNELRYRNDEMSLLTMEKDELLRELEYARHLSEKSSVMQSNLEEELKTTKQQAEKHKEGEKVALEKLSQAQSKHGTALRQLDTERDEKNDLQSELKYSREKGERWKKLSYEIKEERNRLQMQIAELDRNLNEKHSSLAEEKSSLEKEMGTLKTVVKRLKSNEENLRRKIDELRDEVDKLSDVNAEKEMEIRKLSWEKERMVENLVKNSEEENAKLQSECKEINRENTALKLDVGALQEKVKNIRDDNERLQKELKILQDQFDLMQARVHEATQECKKLKRECTVLQDNNSEIMEERERLFNDNSRLKEKKNSIIQERNKLQDMVESLDKCHSEKNDALSRQIALLENELASRQAAVKRWEEKESRLLNEIQQMTEKVEKSLEENVKVNGLLKKTDGENIRLRKKVTDLAKMVEQIGQERESRISLETELHGKEQVVNEFKENKKILNDLVTTLRQEQNQLKCEMRNKEREMTYLKNTLENERNDKLRYKEIIKDLEEELQTRKASELNSIDNFKTEKEKNEQAELILVRIKKERDDLKETWKRNEDEYHKKIQKMKSENLELAEKMQKLEIDNEQVKACNESLDEKTQRHEEKISLLLEKKRQLFEELNKKDEDLVHLTKETTALKEENCRLQKHAENIDKILSLQSTAASDQTSEMETEINVLQDTLVELRTTGDINRAEIDELQRKLKIANDDRMNIELNLNDIRLQRERLEGKNDELLSNCVRLESLLKKEMQLKLEKGKREQLLESEQQRNQVLEEKLADISRELLEKDKALENLKEQETDNRKTIENLTASKDGLIVSVEELSQINGECSTEFHLTSEKNEQLLLENKRLIDLLAFQKEEMENFKHESDGSKTELQLKIQEAENEKYQLQSDVKVKDENLQRLTEINRDLQQNLKNVKTEADDLENENEDLLLELDQLKEVNKKAKEVLSTLQTERSCLQEELREKESNWNVEKEKFSLQIFKFETDSENLNERLTQANERNGKQRELEKMLRLEIDELSDGYVELEGELQHRNDENLSLKEKLQTLSQNIEELELARDTAYLLKERRDCELLKADKNVQRLEKNLKEKQKSIKKLQKDLDSVVEREKILELQISSEKELSGQRCKEIQDLQNSQRKIEEQLWKANRDVENLVTEIETWRTSSESMKVRIETLENELNTTVNDKQMILKQCEETKEVNKDKVKQILKLEANIAENTTTFEKIIGEINHEKSNLKQKLSCLKNVLDKKTAEIANQEKILEDISNKYEDSLLVTSLLHNDIQNKDERIADLEVRKKQVANLLAELDLKIEEIQFQAVDLETENEHLRQQIACSISAEEKLKETIEEERRLFDEKFERNSREIQKLEDTRDELVLKTKRQIEEKNSSIMTIQADYENINDTNKRLETKLMETKSREEKLKQTLKIEIDKTVKQDVEIKHLLGECQSLQTTCSIASKEQKETENNLMQVEIVCQELEDCLKEKNKEIVKIQKHCENAENKTNQLQECIFNLASQNEKRMKMKSEEIRSLTAKNENLKNEIDNVKNELDQQTANSKTNAIEINCLKNKLGEEREQFDDLQVLYQNTINSKDSLEVEKKDLLKKIKTVSGSLEILETEKEKLLTEIKELNHDAKTKEKEFEERYKALDNAQQKLNEEIFDYQMTLEKMLVENNDLRQKVIAGNAKLAETATALGEVRHKLEDEERQNKKLNIALQNLSFEKNWLAEVNSNVCEALSKLKNKTSNSLNFVDHDEQIDDVARNQRQSGNQCLEGVKKTSDEQGQSDYSLRSKQAFAMKSFELQNNFSQIENEIHTLRTLVCEKEREISRLKISSDSQQNEIHVLSSQLTKYKQKFEHKCEQRENALINIKRLETDLEQMKGEKSSFVAESEEKLVRLQQQLLANELMVSNLRKSNVQLEGKIHEINALSDQKMEQIKKLENVEMARVSELEALNNIIEETCLQILKIEDALNICVGENNSPSCSCDNDRKDRFDKLSLMLTRKFERVHENIQSQSNKTKTLQRDLTDAEAQSLVYREELQAFKTAKNRVEIESEQLQKQLFLVTSNNEEALCKVAELTQCLTAAENKMKESQISQNKENLKISQELQKMQRELVLACEKFNYSISKARSLEDKVVTKEKRISDLEGSLKIAATDERKLQIKIAELETTTEILVNTTKELEDKEKEYEEKMAMFQCSLQQEKAARNEDAATRDVTIRQLELKNKSLERQVLRSKELLTRTELSTKELQKEFNTLHSQYNEIQTVSNAELTDCQSNILQLQENTVKLKQDIVRVENERFALATEKEELEKENKNYRNILRQSEREKDLQKLSCEKVFDVALSEEVSNDKNDSNTNLERVIDVIKELRSYNEKLSKEKKSALENQFKLQKENDEIRSKYQTNSEDNELLKQQNSNLTCLTKNLKNDLERSEQNCKQLRTKLHELKENVETLKENEYQQNYQYQLLEKEKENIETELIHVEESIDKLTEKLNDSVQLLREFHPDMTEGNLDDSGIDIESSVKIVSNRKLLDGGIFSPGLDESVIFPEDVENEKMQHLKAVVDMCKQTISNTCVTFSERSRFFSSKEQQLIEEIRVLKQTSDQNEDLLSSLETEVERLEMSQKLLQESYQEKDKNLKEYQMDSEHLKTIANEKEMSIKILHESIQEYKKRQESLEIELRTTKAANELLHKEKLQTSITIQDYEKAFEELRQKCLENDFEMEKKTTSFRVMLAQLNSQIVDKENENLELRYLCETLRATVDQLNGQAQEYFLTIASYKNASTDFENQVYENRERVVLSHEQDGYKEPAKILETVCQENQKYSSDVTNTSNNVSTDLQKSRSEVIPDREDNICNKRKTKAKVGHEVLEEQEQIIGPISFEIRENDELRRKNETKWKLVQRFVQEINESKDRLEKEVSELKMENIGLRKDIKVLQYDNECLHATIKTKEKEIIEADNLSQELDKKNKETQKDFEAANAALGKAMNELHLSLAEAKRIKNVLDSLNELLNSNTAQSCCNTDCEEEMDTYNLISSIGLNINTVKFVCQKMIVEQENLQKDLREQIALVNDARNEKSVIERERQHLDDEVADLSKELTLVKSSLTNQQQELDCSENALSTEKQINVELLNVNLSLQKQIKMLEDDISSISTQAEDLKTDRNNLTESLLKAQDQAAKLKSKYEQLECLNVELRSAKQRIDELNNFKNQSVTAKEELEKMLEYTKERMENSETLHREKTILLNDAQVTLTQERDRIVTLTKLARIKEQDLENAKLAIKLKDEMLGQIKEQRYEMQLTNASTKEELEKVRQQLTTVQQRKETLSNEKVCLWKDCSMLKDQLQEVQKEKRALKLALDSKNSTTSMALEKLERQNNTITRLEDEVEIQKHKREQLENEKFKIVKDAKNKEERLEREYGELYEKSHSQNQKLENNLIHLKGKLSLSESLRGELEERLAGNEKKYSDLKNQNVELQAEIESFRNAIKDLDDQENTLMAENKCWKNTVKNISDESRNSQNSCDKVKQHLDKVTTDQAQEECESDILQKKIVSGEEIRQALRSAALSSKSEINYLKRKALENAKELEKLSTELEHEKDTVTKLLKDKANLEKVYEVSQNMETNLREDLEVAKLQMESVTKKNTSLQSKIDEMEKTVKYLRDDFHTLSGQKLEMDNKLTEATRKIGKANEDLYRVHSAVAKVSAKIKSAENKFRTTISGYECCFDIGSHEEAEYSETSCPLFEPSEKPGCSAANSMFEELHVVEMVLKEVDSSLIYLCEIENTFKDKTQEFILANNKLLEEEERQKDKIKSLQENQNNLVHKNHNLEEKNKEQETLLETLKEECKRVEGLFANECTITNELSNELSSLKDEKQTLCVKNNELGKSLDRYMKENDELKAKQNELKREILIMSQNLSSLEKSYMTLVQEKRQSDEKTNVMKDQVRALESDLEASVEFSELLEKRCNEESENSASLRVRVEAVGAQVYHLEDRLKTSRNQIAKLNSEVLLINEEIHHTSSALRAKENEVARLCEELKTNKEKLTSSNIQMEKYKTVQEGVQKSKRETEEKLEKTKLLLKNSETLLHEEKRLTNDLKIEKKNIQDELQAIIVKYQERIEELKIKLSTVTATEETTKQNLEFARATIIGLENNLKQQLLKTTENDQKEKAANEELRNLKIKYNSIKDKLEQTHQENEALQEEKRDLEKQVENLDTRCKLQCQESAMKFEEIKNLGIEFAREKKVNQDLKREVSKLRKDIDFLKKQNSENEKQFELVLESKNKEKEQMYEKLVDESNKTEELRTLLNAAESEMKKIEEINSDKSQEIFALCQFMVKNLTSNELESCDNNLFEGRLGDETNVIDMIHLFHTLVQDHNSQLHEKLFELNKRLRQTENENETRLIEKAQMEKDLEKVQNEAYVIQENCNSLGKTLETCLSDLELKSNKIKTLEGENIEFKHREDCLQETIAHKEADYLALHTEMEVIEKKRVSLEDDVAKLQLKLANTIVELAAAKTANDVLENKNSELMVTNSSLLDNQAGEQKKLKLVENALSTSSCERKELLEKLSVKENELSSLLTEIESKEKENLYTQKCMEEKENEFILLKEKMNKLEGQKDYLDKQMKKLNELNEQFEKHNKDQGLTISKIQADNNHIRSQLESKQSENMTATRLRCQLEKALTTLESQQRRLSQVQNEKKFLHNQLLEAETELKVLMEDNADLKQGTYQNKSNFSTVDKEELLTTKYQITELRRKEAVLSQENRSLVEQLREKCQELRQSKLKEDELIREVENYRGKMKQYLNKRDKWQEQVNSVISEIDQVKKSETALERQPKLNNNTTNMNTY